MRKSKFLLAFMLVALFVGFTACSSDDDDIVDIKLEKNTIEIEKDSTIKIKITAGNGGYFIPSTKEIAKEEIANATIEGNIITVKGISAGKAIFTIKDKESRSATITVNVFSIVGEWKNAVVTLDVKAKDAAAEKKIKDEFKAYDIKSLKLNSDASFTKVEGEETSVGTYTYKNKVLTLTFTVEDEDDEEKATAVATFNVAELTSSSLKVTVDETEDFKEDYPEDGVTKAIVTTSFTNK